MASVKTPKSIMEEAQKRIRNDGYIRRNAQYAANLEYYEGKQKKSGVHDMQAADAKGRPLLRDLGNSLNMNRTIVANRISPVVDDYQGLLGRWPTVRVPAPIVEGEGQGTQDAADRKAQKQTRLLHSTFQIAQIERQQAQAGFQLSAMGDTVYILEPDWEKKRIVPSVVDPRFCFPSFHSGWRHFELRDLLIAYTLDRDSIKEEYGVDLAGEDDEANIWVITYLSASQRTIVLGEKSLVGGENSGVPHQQWDFDFCPAEWVHNKLTQNNRFGLSDIKDLLALQDAYNFSLNVGADALVEMTYPIRAVINPMRFGQDQITVGPGEVVALEEGGDIKVVAPTPPPTALHMFMDRTLEDMNAASGSTATRQTGEQPHSSIATGRSLHAAQGPQATRVDLRQILLGVAIRNLCSRLLQMQETAPQFDEFMKDKGLEIQGRYQGKSFREVVKAQDIDGWYQVMVSFDQLLGASDQQKLFVATQGIAAGIGDDIWAREQMGIEDPLGMRDRVEAYKLHSARLQAQEAQAAQGVMPGQQGPGGPPGQPGPGGPPGQAPGGPPNPQAPPQQIPFRPPGLSPQGPQNGLPQGITLQAARQALGKVADQLKGTVWATGDLALAGQSTAPAILISDFRDQRAVTQALSAIAPGLKVKAVPEADMPDLKERLA